MTDGWNGRNVRKARAWIAAQLPAPCSKCGREVTADMEWHADHVTPRALTDKWTWNDRDNLAPAHRRCNERSGGRLGAARAKAKRQAAKTDAPRSFSGAEGQPLPAPLPNTPRNSTPTARRPRLRAVKAPRRLEVVGGDLGEPPEGFAPPRVFTEPHSKAAGSYGPALIAQAAAQGITLRYWQQYVAYRLLEHDDDGQLLWEEAAISVGRQQGKGFGALRPYAEWRTSEAATAVFGEPQIAVHVAHQLNTAREIAEPAFARAKSLGHRVRLANGEMEITRPDGARWLVRSATGAYGFSANAVLVDEVWSVQPRVIDSMLRPLMLARSHPQIVMYSTANAQATPVYVRHRADAGEDTGKLVIEWSAEPGSDWTDPAVWRSASPDWSPARERMMARSVGSTSQADFTANFLNVWPDIHQVRAWAAPGFAGLPQVEVPDPGRGGVVAVDELRDGTGFARVVWEGRRAWYSEHRSLGEALARGSSATTVLLGVSLAEAARNAGLRHKPTMMGSRESRAGTPLLEQACKTAAFAHDHHPLLLEQARAAVTTESESGRVVSARASGVDVVGVKLLAWCLLAERNGEASRAMVW